MQAIGPKHHCSVFNCDPAIGREKERAGKPDDEVGYFWVGTDVFANARQIHWHSAEKVG